MASVGVQRNRMTDVQKVEIYKCLSQEGLGFRSWNAVCEHVKRSVGIAIEPDHCAKLRQRFGLQFVVQNDRRNRRVVVGKAYASLVERIAQLESRVTFLEQSLGVAAAEQATCQSP